MDSDKTYAKGDTLINIVKESSTETYKVLYLPHMLSGEDNSIYEISYHRINRGIDNRSGSITTTLLLRFNNGSEAQISRDMQNRRLCKTIELKYRNRGGKYLKNPKARLKGRFKSMNLEVKQSILEQLPQKARSLLEKVL